MFSKAYSAAIHGVDGLIVSVEADVSDGLPMFDMVGIKLLHNKYTILSLKIRVSKFVNKNFGLLF